MAKVRAAVTRVLVGTVCATLLAIVTGCGGQGSEGSPNANAGAGSATAGGGAAGASSSSVAWCDAYEIINCSCQQCHQNPPINGAPIPLVTYADTQVAFPAASTSPVWQTMQRVIAARSMPFTGDPTVMPKVMPLSDAEQAKLLGWLAEGAKPTGGTACPEPSCVWAH